jgi:hypothetical protein
VSSLISESGSTNEACHHNWLRVWCGKRASKTKLGHWLSPADAGVMQQPLSACMKGVTKAPQG